MFRTGPIQVRRRPRADNQYLAQDVFLFGIRIYTRIIDSEIIPDHVMISLGCYGDTGGWKSKFSHNPNWWKR